MIIPNITIGTAGHIDHGKTSLVRFLTGCDTDTLREEKERQITIDLGHAPCTIGDYQVGIVDVPGHESFIKTMVAGACSMDGVIFVVAADDGIMPQTKEHLDILTLIGVKHGIIALTKKDRVSKEELEDKIMEIQGFLKGTFLENSSIYPVDNLTGEGFFEFQDGLIELIKTIPLRETEGIFYMPVERAFSSLGKGTVLFGVPTSGEIYTNDMLTLYPHRLRCKVRDIQVFCEKSACASAGECAGINAPALNPKKIKRGDVLSNIPNLQSSSWFFVKVKTLPNIKETIKNGDQIRLYTGTTEVTVIVYFNQSGTKLTANNEEIIQISTSSPIVILPGQKFIIRNMQRNVSLGGGTFLQINNERIRRNHVDSEYLNNKSVALASTKKDLILHCLDYVNPALTNFDTLMGLTFLTRKELLPILEELREKDIILGKTETYFILQSRYLIELDKVTNCLKQFHEEFPECFGATKQHIREILNIDKNLLNYVLERADKSNILKVINNLFSIIDHTPKLEETDSQLVEAMSKLFKIRLFIPPLQAELPELLCATDSECKKSLAILQERGTIIYLAKQIFIHKDAIPIAIEVVKQHIKKTGQLYSVDFKYLIDTTRRCAIPLLDHLDKYDFLIRDGYTRYLREKPSKD